MHVILYYIIFVFALASYGFEKLIQFSRKVDFFFTQNVMWCNRQVKKSNVYFEYTLNMNFK